MYNEQLIQNICNLDCSCEQLRKFCSCVKDKNLRRKNAFDKYYNLNTILLALIKFEQGEANEVDMMYWAEAYHHLISDGVKAEFGQGPTVEQYVKQRIVSCVYELIKFFDDYYPQCSGSLVDYKIRFSALDFILSTVSDCYAIYSRKNQQDKFPTALIVNDERHYFINEIYFYGDWDKESDCKSAEFETVSPRNAQKRIEQMRSCGYRQLYMW